jgi:hypothetical protein
MGRKIDDGQINPQSLGLQALVVSALVNFTDGFWGDRRELVYFSSLLAYGVGGDSLWRLDGIFFIALAEADEGIWCLGRDEKVIISPFSSLDFIC